MRINPAECNILTINRKMLTARKISCIIPIRQTDNPRHKFFECFRNCQFNFILSKLYSL